MPYSEPTQNVSTQQQSVPSKAGVAASPITVSGLLEKAESEV